MNSIYKPTSTALIDKVTDKMKWFITEQSYCDDGYGGKSETSVTTFYENEADWKKRILDLTVARYSHSIFKAGMCTFVTVTAKVDIDIKAP